MEHSQSAVKVGDLAPASRSYLRHIFGIAEEGYAQACTLGPDPRTDARLTDRDIRRALKGVFQIGGLTGSDLIVEEVECWRGYVRADYLCLRDDDLAVIEIKSDRDTLSRFDEQVRVYSAIADRVTLIVGWSLAARALRKAPWWWQVLLAERTENAEPRFVPLRDGARNPTVDATALLSMLPTTDLRVLAKHVGVRETNQPHHLRELVALRASEEDLRNAVRRWLTRISDQRRSLQS
ncbi:MAG: hypothetical protein ABS52_19280 [Gemmatimonadetes bacterium SCN 70-22]|jgi:hypothetical protein|nr:MAG: hypothetical protein ABS52_19280 [Gemmatimonadetes bacterium SCN 70-22]